MIAVIQTGGKQYVVKEGDMIRVEKLANNPGDKVELDVLLKGEGDKVEIGAPLLTGKVQAEVIEQGRTDKVEVIKYKPKSRYTRRVGHRQAFTKLKITKI